MTRCNGLHPIGEEPPAAAVRVHVLEAGTERSLRQLDLCGPCLAAFVEPWVRHQARPMAGVRRP